MPRNICSPPRGRGTVQRGSAPGPLSPNVLCTHRCIAASLHRFGTCSNASRSIVDRSLGLGIKLDPNTRENPSENPSSSSENPPAALLCLSLARELRILLPKKKEQNPAEPRIQGFKKALPELNSPCLLRFFQLVLGLTQALRRSLRVFSTAFLH